MDHRIALGYCLLELSTNPITITQFSNIFSRLLFGLGFAQLIPSSTCRDYIHIFLQQPAREAFHSASRSVPTFNLASVSIGFSPPPPSIHPPSLPLATVSRRNSWRRREKRFARRGLIDLLKNVISRQARTKSKRPHKFGSTGFFFCFSLLHVATQKYTYNTHTREHTLLYVHSFRLLIPFQ